jgi:xanthine dehydrogenase YagS FAD-binding subunit
VRAFRFVRPRDPAQAVEALAEGEAALLAGGVDLLDRMKERVDEPPTVVGLLDLAECRGVREEADGTLAIGALVTLGELAASAPIRARVPALAEAAGDAASLQIRNRATLGGNLAQGTRCGYWRHRSFPCLLRGDEVCPVRGEGGVQEQAGIFANDPCASAHPSSVAPLLGACGAAIEVLGPGGRREVPFGAFWRAPARGRASFTVLGPAEMIVAVRLPPATRARRVGRAEVRQRAAFDWPLVSCAVGLDLDGDRVRDAHIWLGSVAPTPHPAAGAVAALRGGPCDAARIEAAAARAVEGAAPLPGTAYKTALVRVAVRRAHEDPLRRS